MCSERVPECGERVGRLYRPLLHPPVVRTLEHDGARAQARGGVARHRGRAGVVIFGRDDHQPRPMCGRSRRNAEIAQHRLQSRAVQLQDALRHGWIHRRGDVCCGSAADSQRREEGDLLVERAAHHRRHGGFTRRRRLPHLRGVVPRVVGMQQSGAVGRPRSDEVAAVRDDAEHVTCAPVVPHQVNVAAQTFELRRQPRVVALVCGVPPARHRRAEAGRREQRDVAHAAAAQLIGQWPPHGFRFRIAVHECVNHGGLPAVLSGGSCSSAGGRRVQITRRAFGHRIELRVERDALGRRHHRLLRGPCLDARKRIDEHEMIERCR